MAEPLVSVVVASFNGERFVAETLDSVFAQDYEPYEVVFVDDGSTDGTGEIAQSYPLRYLARENGGLAAARNTGVAEAGGEYVTFIDDDDLMPPTRLSLQAGRLAEARAGDGERRRDQRRDRGVQRRAVPRRGDRERTEPEPPARRADRDRRRLDGRNAGRRRGLRRRNPLRAAHAGRFRRRTQPRRRA